MARRVFANDAGERVTLQARTTTRIRDKLEEAAKRNGRSLSQEMEMRLHDSLLIEDVSEKISEQVNNKTMTMTDMLGGQISFSFLRDLSEIIMFTEGYLGTRWYDSAESKAFLYNALEKVLPAAISMERKPQDAAHDPLWRTLELVNLLPFAREKKPPAVVPDGVRFATEEEVKQIFFLNEDNADPQPKKTAKARPKSAG
jgi:hypothetical protein